MIKSRLMICLLVGLILIQIMCVTAFEFDNVKGLIGIGKIGYPNIEIKNAFGFGSTIAELELTDNTNVCGIDCLAQTTIKLNEDGSLIDDIIFYTIITNNKAKEVNRYPQEIKEFSIYYKEQSGKEWLKYNLGDKVTSGSYKIKIEGQKVRDITIDWQIKTQGIWTTEWATWQGIPYCSSADDYCLIVSADNINIPAVQVNTVIVTNITGANNLWKINTSSTNSNLSRAKVLGTLFYGTDDGTQRNSNARILNITNIKNIYSNNPIDNNMSAYFAFWNITSGGCNDVTRRTFPFTNTGANYVSTWSFMNSNNNQNVNVLLIPAQTCTTDCIAGTVINSATASDSQQLLTDQSVDERYANVSAGVSFYNGNCGTFDLKYRILFGASNGTVTNGTLTGGTQNYYSMTRFTEDLGIPRIEYAGGLYVSLNSPNVGSTTPSVVFNCSASTINSLINISLYTNYTGSWVLNKTTAVTGLSNTTTFANSYPDTSFDWTCSACDDYSCRYAPENRTINTDGSLNSIVINSGNGTQNYGSLLTNHTINYTITDANLNTCWLDYAGTNRTIPCTSGSINTTNFALTSNNYNATIWANDSLSNVGSNSFNWSYKVFENSRTYNSPVIEQNIESFILNVNIPNGITSARLNYNGTVYNSNILNLGLGVYNISNNIMIPDFATASNVSFYFNITTTDGTSIPTELYYQYVQSVLIGNCSTYSYQLFNLSLFDEKLLVPLNGSIEADISFLNQEKTAELSNVSILFSNVKSAVICSNINTTGSGMFYNLELRYYAYSVNSTYSHVPELYYIQQGNTDNLPIWINLYDLAIDESTEFTINYRDNNYVAKPGVLLQIQRKYIDEGIYRTVEAPLTSNGGITVGHFDLNNYIYKIVASLNGDILNEFNDVAVVCQSELSGICVINLNGQGTPNPYEDIETDTGLSYIITQTNNTITVSYTIPSGETEEVNVYMIQNSPTHEPIVLCNTSLVSSSGTFECTADSLIGDSSVDIQLRWNDNIRRASAYIQEDLGSFFLLNNYVIGALFIIMLVTMTVASPAIMVIAAMFSIVLLGFMFLLKGSSIGLTLGTISWLIVSGIIILIKLHKQEET